MPSIGDWTMFLLRWFHFLAGITWIGMLYYFNFVQVPFFAGADAPVRTGMITGGLVSRALWWFRWGAMLTFITGWLYLLHRIGQLGGVHSRTNTMLSIPMLFFMGAASHWAFFTPTARGAKIVMLVVFAIILAIVEANAVLGPATPDKASAGKKLLSTVKGTLWAGFVLTAILAIALKIIFG